MNRKNIISTLLCTLIAASINFGALAMDDSTTEQGTADTTNSQQYNGESSSTESSPFSVTSEEEEESTPSADAPSEEIYEVE